MKRTRSSARLLWLATACLLSANAAVASSPQRPDTGFPRPAPSYPSPAAARAARERRENPASQPTPNPGGQPTPAPPAAPPAGGAAAPSATAMQARLERDLAGVADRSWVLEGSAADVALKQHRLRITVRDLRRSASELRRRVDVERDVGGSWIPVQTALVIPGAKVGGRGVLDAYQWTPESRPAVLRAPLTARLAGTELQLGDVLLLEPSWYRLSLRESRGDTVAEDVFDAGGTLGGVVDLRLTFRRDLAVATTVARVTPGTAVQRTADWLGWKATAGTQAPARMRLSEGSNLLAAFDVTSFTVNRHPDASLFVSPPIVVSESRPKGP